MKSDSLIERRVRTVTHMMGALYEALKPTFGSRNASDLAFHCAEIDSELPALPDIINRAIVKKKIRKKDLRELETMLPVHWPNHIGHLRRIFKRLSQ
jgi:hypothetical protein